MENKKNRNKKLAIIAAMLALIVLILCLGGTTFAKYISANTYEAKNVTVAKWGFVIEADGKNMFSEQYNKGTVVTKDDVDGGADVDIKATTLTVAPGASGSMTFGVTGSAEVLSKLTIKATGEDVALVYTPDGGEETTYNPIKWTLKKTGETETTLVNGKTLADVITAIDGLSKDSLAIGTEVEESYELSWEWTFTVDENTDILDTALAAYTATKDSESADDIVTTFTTTVTAGEDDDATTTTVTNTIDTTKTVVNFDFKLEIKVEQIQNA